MHDAKTLGFSGRLALGAAQALLVAACIGHVESADPGQQPEERAGSGAGPSGGGTGQPIQPGQSTQSDKTPLAEIPVAGCEPRAFDPGPSFLRRLTNPEYQRTVRDLLGEVADPTAEFPADAIRAGFDNNSESITISNAHVEKYRDAAEQLATEVMGDPARRGRLIGCSPATDGPDCLQRFIETFGRRAYRRPLQPDEVKSFLALAGTAGGGSDPYGGARIVMQAMLMSPNFLFWVEVGRPDPARPGLLKLTGFEVATRLSYLLLGTTPDDALLVAAEQGKLDTPEGVETAVRTLIADERSRQAMRTFYGQWLKISDLGSVSREEKDYPLWGPALMGSMREETTRLIDDFLWGESANFLDLLTAPYTYVDEALRKIYGAAPGSKEWTRLAFSPSDGRAGLLTQPSILAVTGVSEDSLPIHRGVFVREQILCHHVPLPPDDVPQVPLPRPGQSDRERLAEHSKSAACAACHALMDPIGFALSGFDMIGAPRKLDSGGQPIYTKGSLSGFATVEFDGAIELGNVLRRSPDLSTCVATQLFRYARGREETHTDRCAIQQIDSAFQSSGYHFSALLRAFVRSDAFRYRRPHTGS
jgi:hypothetical protein